MMQPCGGNNRKFVLKNIPKGLIPILKGAEQDKPYFLLGKLQNCAPFFRFKMFLAAHQETPLL
ncbi:hypothetical protein H1P_300021 [Hyella patelloides LEGE 07179]|uniref:Uncharacterized protein n=1 Tax=Hyella patelloides LEGE 07179 TaxID=945734 RepID=A0A563VUD9_9CYAN|nr:hypothetical protein H1P_300021 [Hyella patelloides LEGE 07179]